ncbi:FUSC family protein [Streptomyces sp. 1222.5]|uniref:FUSC family protein n=1 Tax=Streptomyces sp. 1222.5 TaxID=1881026 RepID=UPI003D759D6C
MQGVRVSAITARIARVGCAEAGRATVAAGLTWQTCAALLHTPDPYAGAVAALLIVETTVVRTVGAALRYAAGCLLGVLVAVPGALYTEPAMLGLGFVVFASVLLARQGFLGHYGLHVPTTALITYALVRGRHSGELTSHLAEIVVGIAFGLACSALLCPTVRVRSAERALEDLRVLIARHLDGLADAAVRRERPRKVLGTTWEDDLDTALTRARAAVDEAHESMRWNVRPTARRRRWHLDRRVLETLTDVAGRVAATGRLLDTHPSAAGVPRPASAASGADAGFSPAHGGVTGRTSDSPERVRAAAPERGPGSPGHPGHPGPGNTGATEKLGTGRVPTSTGPGEAAAPGPGPAHTGAPVHRDPASAVCPGRADPGTTATRGPHTHPAALDRFSPGHPAVAGGHGTAAVLAEPYARLLRTTALCVYSCRGGRPHPALPAARRAVARLGAPAAEPTGADAEDRRLLRHLDQALTRLSAPAPAPPARPARPRRTSTPLRTSLRR